MSGTDDLRDLYPVGLVDCDAAGRITYLNARMRDWLEAGDGAALLGRPFYALLTPAGRIYFETHLRPMLMLEGGIEEISLELISATGRRTRIYLSGRVAADDANAVHLVCFGGADRQRYEQELLLRRRKAEAYEAMVAASPDAILNIDTEQHILAWNAAAERLLGHSAEQALGRTLHPLIVPDDRQAEHADQLAAIADGHAVTVETARRHRDGSAVPVEVSMARITDERGVQSGAVIILRDITERQRQERIIQTLNSEVLHRSKNLLAVVGSIATMTARSTGQGDFARVFQERLTSLGNNLTLLVDRNWGAVALDALIESQLAHLGARALSRVRVEGPEVPLDPGKAEGLGMALFELSTNALKYGALSGDAGRIAITWAAQDADGAIALNWREAMDGPCTPPTRKGFGSDLTGRLLESRLGGRVTADFTPTGLHWTCIFTP